MALFIGSFNPPTLAHLTIALSLKNDFNKIIFIPVNSKYKKLIDFRHRVNMLKIYKRKYSFIDVDDIMLNYSYFDYRILDLLKEKYHDNIIIVGSDLFKKIKFFDNYEYLLNNYLFYVILRDNDTCDIINDYLKYQDRIKLVNLKIDISSTQARYMLENKGNLLEILDSDVISYIKDNHLYF